MELLNYAEQIAKTIYNGKDIEITKSANGLVVREENKKRIII
jgi:hypothetical protein